MSKTFEYQKCAVVTIVPKSRWNETELWVVSFNASASVYDRQAFTMRAENLIEVRKCSLVILDNCDVRVHGRFDFWRRLKDLVLGKEKEHA